MQKVLLLTRSKVKKEEYIKHKYEIHISKRIHSWKSINKNMKKITTCRQKTYLLIK